MENISFKLETAMSKQIEKDLADFHYGTKTEFIREAIRDKLKENEEERRKKAWNALFAARGIFKGKGKTKTDEEWRQWRKENGEKMAQELAKKYGIKI